MSESEKSTREFLKITGLAAGATLVSPRRALAHAAVVASHVESVSSQNEPSVADYTLHIKESPIEIAPKRIISAATYNGQFPGPLLRFKEGQQLTVDIYNDSDTPEQRHWHGQKVSTDVDGAAEEGTPFVPAHGKRRITFTPDPSGLRLLHRTRVARNLSRARRSTRQQSGLRSRSRTCHCSHVSGTCRILG
jgi:FtsP/CotA-like multicopper oxidase with cupredoxin domain